MRASLEIDPRQPKAHTYLAIALAKRGELDDAIAHVREALGIDPDYPDAKKNLPVLLRLQAMRQDP